MDKKFIIIEQKVDLIKLLRLGLMANTKVYRMGVCSIMVAQEPRKSTGELLWHLSISCVKRYPTWDEIKEARYKLMPGDICVAMLLPQIEKYVNVHPNCFHLWEVKEIEG